MLRKTGGVRRCAYARADASMRPQRNAAENPDRMIGAHKPRIASMRPQRNAAENMRMGDTFIYDLAGFNEAAA